jgi:hypothetical protein
MTQSEITQLNGWQPYDLDHHAQQLVLQHRDTKDILNESHKMRVAVAYGLERFWGEHLRLGREKPAKGRYWKSVWATLAEILKNAEVILPDDNITAGDTEKIKVMAQRIWSMPIEEQRIALMVLTQLCDALVWWTQRYKVKNSDNSDR